MDSVQYHEITRYDYTRLVHSVDRMRHVRELMTAFLLFAIFISICGSELKYLFP
jgi:hypothetical protein